VEEVLVVHAVLTAEIVFDGDCECLEEVDYGLFWSVTRALASSMFAGPPGIVAVESVIRFDARGVCERRD
jgi:hypothetical protein